MMQPQVMQMMSQMGGQPGQMQMMNPAMAQPGRPQGRQYQNRQSNHHHRSGPRQNHQQRQTQNQPQVAKQWTLDYLKEHLQEFMDYNQDKKRSILGELLFPKIKALLKSNDQNAPKITGMLIDFEVFEVSDIIEFLESEEALLERVKEAEELISQQA